MLNAQDGEPNPWLSIPASDYEGHMGHAAVGQLQFLNDIFRELIAEYQPRCLAVLGCTTGNGFEHLAAGQVERVVGIDLNSAYLKVARERFGEKLPGLELICSDVVDCTLEPHSLDLVHAALVLEYVDPAVVVERAAAWLRRGGAFTAVLQLPSEGCGKVSETGFASLKTLDPVMRLVDPELLEREVRRHGLDQVEGRTVTLRSGKAFHLAVYRRGETAGSKS